VTASSDQAPGQGDYGRDRPGPGETFVLSGVRSDRCQAER
jgi:hypothetical protein